MSNKRNNELVASVNNILNQNANINEDEKKAIADLVKAYENNTYDNWSDRHQYYRDIVDSMVNDCGFEDKELAKAMANNHCTLQQSFFRMVLYFLNEMAKDGKYYDDRNKKAVELSKMMINAIKDENQYVPFI